VLTECGCGYDEQDDVVEALEHCDHDFEAAAAWLLGERGEVGMEDDDDGHVFEDGGGGSMLDTLMREPRLQQALSNPNVVSALQVRHWERVWGWATKVKC
jgi:hypothetical protein